MGFFYSNCQQCELLIYKEFNLIFRQ